MIQNLINKLYKGAQYSWVLLTTWFCTRIFKTLLWLNKIKAGKDVKTMKAIPSLIINRNAKHVSLGNNVIFNNYGDHSWYCKCKLVVREGASLIIGNNVGMNGVWVFCSDSIRIGENVKIGGGTRVYDTNFHSLDYIQRRNSATDKAKSAPIVIEDDAFIGAGVFIGKGVHIGTRSIIAAGTVVIKDIPSDCIAGGNPCKIIKRINE